MFKLIIVTEIVTAETALKIPTSVTPDTSIALYTDGVSQRTATRVCLQTFTTVTHPRLAEITDSSHHSEAGNETIRMLYNTVASLQHTLHFTTVSAHRQSLEGSAKIAERSIFLLPFTFITLHGGITRDIRYVTIIAGGFDLFLSLLLLLGLFTLTCLLLRHDRSKLSPLEIKWMKSFLDT